MFAKRTGQGQGHGHVRGLLFFAALTIMACSSSAFGADCNGSGVPDQDEIKSATSEDCNESGIPDECEQHLLDVRSNEATIELPDSPSKFFAADMDQDGDLDIVTANEIAQDSQVAVYLNQVGERGVFGEFSEPESYPLGSSPIAMDHGDLDGDGDNDVAVVLPSNTVAVLWNVGDGAGFESESIPLRR